MYFFYLDESGSRDLNAGTDDHPTHIYVLLAVGMYEGQWGHFEREVSGLKLMLSDDLQQRGFGEFELANCEVKSNWLRHPKGREKGSAFLTSLTPGERQKITEVYFAQIAERNAVVMAAVIDKRSLPAGTTAVTLHQQAYELALQRIQRYMEIYHRKHRALIVMDDTDKNSTRSSRCNTHPFCVTVNGYLLEKALASSIFLLPAISRAVCNLR